MIVKRLTGISLFAITIATVVVWLGTTGSALAAPPIKENLASRVGWEVIPGGKICTSSNESCQPGLESSEPGGFSNTEGVAVNRLTGNVYVADEINSRVQEFSATGQFIAMFGAEVNETTGANICTQQEIESSGVKCKAGTLFATPLPGQFSVPMSIAVDPNSGNVYVQDPFYYRVQEFTPSGEFVLMIGKGVNETTGGNVCTKKEAKEGVICKAGEPSSSGSTEAGAFKFEFREDVLAAGGPEDLLYVGDEQRVQRFNSEGEYKGSVDLTPVFPQPEGFVTGLAVEDSGDLYVAYHFPGGSSNIIAKLEADGKEIRRIEPTAEPGVVKPEVQVAGLAVDSSSRLAVSGFISGFKGGQSYSKRFGRLFSGTTGAMISEFPAGSGGGLAFAANDALYQGSTPYEEEGELHGQEFLIFTPVNIAELVTLPAPACAPGPDHEADATFSCVLKGEANPEGIAETKVEFQVGEGFSEQTPSQSLTTDSIAHSIEDTLEGLRPKETVPYRLAGNDQNVQPPEEIVGEAFAITLPSVPPRVVGTPSTPVVGSSSAVMFAEIDPENSNTEYEFEYGPCAQLAGCPGLLRTNTQESSVYGTIGVTQEVTGLQPSTVYHYRLAANGGEAVGPEGSFTTAPVPAPQAETGGVSEVTATTATIFGAANPDGAQATYNFLLGVYNGTHTQFGVLVSGQTGNGASAVPESFHLIGLQPGTTYAYQIRVQSGFGTATGAIRTFTTAGSPAVLVSPPSLPLLETPKDMHFPSRPAVHKKPLKKKKRKHKRHKGTKHTHKRTTAKNKRG